MSSYDHEKQGEDTMRKEDHECTQETTITSRDVWEGGANGCESWRASKQEIAIPAQPTAALDSGHITCLLPLIARALSLSQSIPE